MLDIKKNHSLKEHNSFLFEYSAEYFCEVNSIEEGHEFIEFCLKKKLPLKILGEGTNVVLTKNIKGALLKVSIPGKKILNEDVIIGAGENWNDVVLWSLKKELFGLENLTLIPGSVGAAPVQNIGAYGEEISSKIKSLEVINLKTNELISLKNSDCKFRYRDSIFKKENNFLISTIKLNLSKNLNTNTSYNSLNSFLIKDDIDPDNATPYQVCRAVNSIRTKILPDYKDEPNVGSFFKNLLLDKKTFIKLNSKIKDVPYFRDLDKSLFKVHAAFIIEKSGWKGKEIGNVKVSEIHALVLVVKKGADSKELLEVSSKITKDILEKLGVNLEIEPNIY